jgi:hypothetical protein
MATPLASAAWRSTFCMIPAAAFIGGCGPVEPEGTPLDHGQWRLTTEFSTPKIDGLSLDSLRKQLPADRERTECTTPVVRTGARFMEMFNFNESACDLTSASSNKGTITAEGQCPALAARIASAGGGAGYKIDHGKSWIKINGTYEPDYLKVDADIIMTVTTDRGETSRLTVNATHTAERTGDCS